MSKLEETKAATEKAFQQLKAAVDNSADPQTLLNRFMNYAQSLEARMGYLEDTVQNHRDDALDRMGEHMKGHLPAAKSREHMAKAIKNLGWGEEYEAAPKQVVYAKTKFGTQAIIGKDVEIE